MEDLLKNIYQKPKIKYKIH